MKKIYNKFTLKEINNIKKRIYAVVKYYRIQHKDIIRIGKISKPMVSVYLSPKSDNMMPVLLLCRLKAHYPINLEYVYWGDKTCFSPEDNSHITALEHIYEMKMKEAEYSER